MLSRSNRISRRRLLAAGVGVSFGYLLLNRRRTFSAPDVTPRNLMWVWMFSEDGPPNTIGRKLVDHGLGIVVKTHDGKSWMSEFDKSPYAVSGPAQTRVLADYFENAGVPFHAWAVVTGEDPLLEASMAADVFASGARSLFIDMGSSSGSWKGDDAAARTLGENIRSLNPDGHVVLVADARMWLSSKVPLAAVAPYCDSIAVKALWRTYDAGDARAFEQAGYDVPPEGITPELVYAAGVDALKGYALPKTWIADGSSNDASEFERFLLIAKNGGADYTSIWRYGTTSDDAWSVLSEPQVLPPVAATVSDYVVQLGDTLSGIAAAHAVSVDDLVKANKLADPNLIVEGQHLVIP